MLQIDNVQKGLQAIWIQCDFIQYKDLDDVI